MPTKLPAKHLTIYAIYRTMAILGNPSRHFIAAFPTSAEATRFLDAKLASEPWHRKADYMLEPMSATMKSWQPSSC